jgi:hypothetical protein
MHAKAEAPCITLKRPPARAAGVLLNEILFKMHNSSTLRRVAGMRVSYGGRVDNGSNFAANQLASMIPAKGNPANSPCLARPRGQTITVSFLGPIAQRLEQATHNRLVTGSNPVGPTNSSDGLG